MRKPASEDLLPVKPIRVLLAEDHAEFRKSLKLLIELNHDIQVVGEARNGHQAIVMNLRFLPDLIVMDIGMPQLNGLRATRKIIEMSPTTRVLMLSSYPDPEYIRQAIVVGASGYLIKQSSAPIVVDAIREVLKGKTYFSTSIPKQLRDECQKIFNKREILKQ